MKKIIAFLLTAVMLLSLTACGGGNDNTPPSNTNKPTNSDTGSKEDESEVKFVITQYGSNPDYEVYTATIYCPEGAYFDEDEYAEYLAQHCATLPLFPEMTDEEVEMVIEAVNQY